MKTIPVILNPQGRAALYDSFERAFNDSMALVRIVDVVSQEYSILNIPTSPRAEVIAREPPRLMPGCVTALISYVALPFKSLLVIEYKLLGTSVESRRTVLLIPERQGRACRGDWRASV